MLALCANRIHSSSIGDHDVQGFEPGSQDILLSSCGWILDPIQGRPECLIFRACGQELHRTH